MWRTFTIYDLLTLAKIVSAYGGVFIVWIIRGDDGQELYFLNIYVL
jgi:hypothetical protein